MQRALGTSFGKPGTHDPNKVFHRHGLDWKNAKYCMLQENLCYIACRPTFSVCTAVFRSLNLFYNVYSEFMRSINEFK